MTEIATTGISRSWKEVDESAEREIEDIKMNNYLIRDMREDIKSSKSPETTN